MKERNFNQDIYMNFSLSLKIDELQTVISSLNISENKVEKLIEHKSHLEKILDLIKNSQKNLIIKKRFRKSNISNIKQTLISLNNNLFRLKADKEKSLKLLENLRNQKIKHFYKIKNSNNSFMNSFKKNFSSNFDSLISETTGNESYGEVSQLKNLNFEVENELQKLDNIKKQMLLEINYYNLSKDFKKVTRINYLNNTNNDDEMINKILHNKLIAKRNNFVNLANLKNTQGEDINFIQDKINFFKIKLKKKIQSTKNLIRKNKKFYIETIKEDSENDDISINNNIPIKFENFNKSNKIINDKLDSIKINNNNNSNKDSGSEETNYNSSDKKESL